MMKSLLILMLFVACALTTPVDTRADGPLHPQDAPRTEAAVSATQLDLNRATAVELEALPGIGPATAKRIIEYREKNGPFQKVEDLMNVRGIGEKSFLKLRPQLTVGTGGQPRAASTQP
jgi:competence ComEA-like helix-hairpin-helix protein